MRKKSTPVGFFLFLYGSSEGRTTPIGGALPAKTMKPGEAIPLGQGGKGGRIKARAGGTHLAGSDWFTIGDLRYT
jgi:hypothetical protein